MLAEGMRDSAALKGDLPETNGVSRQLSYRPNSVDSYGRAKVRFHPKPKFKSGTIKL